MTLTLFLALLGLLALWVLLPLVPAILIYRLFPNTPVVAAGPLAGLRTNASGAFAAYLIVFVITFFLVSSIRDSLGEPLEQLAYFKRSDPHTVELLIATNRKKIASSSQVAFSHELNPNLQFGAVLVDVP